MNTSDGRRSTSRTDGAEAHRHPAQPASLGPTVSLSTLYQQYGVCLYHFACRRGYNAHDAQDLLQSFVLRVLEKQDLAPSHTEGICFRTWLTSAFRHYISNHQAAAHAQKRGGSCIVVSLSALRAAGRYPLEPSIAAEGERILERQWANTLQQKVMQGIRDEYGDADKLALFDALQHFLVVGRGEVPYAALRTQLGMSTGAVKVAICRLRSRYRNQLETELRGAVENSEDAESALYHLMEVLGE